MFRWNNKKEDMFSLMLHKIAHFYPVEETNNLEKLKEMPVIVYKSDKHDMCIRWIIYLIFPFLSCMIKINSRLFIGHHLEVRLSLVSFWEPAG